MIPTEEITVRAGLAVDCLANQIFHDGGFVSWVNQVKERDAVLSGWADPYHQLLAASLLLSASSTLGRPYALKPAFEVINRFSEASVSRNDSLFIHGDDGSLSSWNAIMSHIMFKMVKRDKAFQYANSLKECVTKRVLKNVPGTGPTTVSSQPGLVVMSLLEAYRASHDESYLESAKTAAAMIPIYNQLNPFNAWALVAIWEHEGWIEDNRKLKHIELISKNTEIDLEVSRGLIVPFMLQAVLAHEFVCKHIPQETPDWLDRRIRDCIKLQFGFQVDFTHNFGYDVRSWQGAIVKEPGDPIIRIDYILYTVFGFLQYLLLTERENRTIAETPHIY